MAYTLKILTIGAMVATAAMLLVGIINMFRNSPSSESSNKMMRWRVILQAVTLALFSALLLTGKH